MRVRKGGIYVYVPCLLDKFDGRTNLKENELVRVIHPPGCPAPNTMGHAHVERLDGTFVGLVATNSLEPKPNWHLRSA